ncbi:MAG: TrkH family potassium uptake protein [Coriobacteriia bacterium]|nr:TrkH family potassium uptake protein [Coriobacteriia bacterium]
MWLRLRLSDVRTIVRFVGVFIVGIGIAMSVPLLTAVVWGEWGPALDYLAGIGVALAIGMLLVVLGGRADKITYAQAFSITALGWLTASLVAAVPLALSGNYGSYLDAAFDALSGLTTSGLTVVNDLDHMAHAHNMWRHLTHLIGGQGIVVAALSLTLGLKGGGVSLYQAEGRDERILPGIMHTVRFIWIVTAAYVSIGTTALFVITSYSGMPLGRAFLHAFWAAVATYDTGGFGPQSMNAMYYHSPLFEFVTLFLMLAGAMNFSLHAQIWRGGFAEIWHNIEVRVLVVSISLLSLVAAAGLSMSRLFASDSMGPWRKGVYHVISAHTGTGHQTVYNAQWIEDLGPQLFVAVLMAMAAGGAVSSTAGGIKALRIGLIGKTFVQQIKVGLAPRSAVIRTRYHHLSSKLLTPEAASAAGAIFILYTLTYVVGAFIGVEYGFDFRAAAFESISATANVGLSTGITSSAMPTGLKLTYMFQMWAGRLEFLAVFVLIAHVFLGLKGLVTRRHGR